MTKILNNILIVLLLCSPVATFSQLANGGINAGFGVDGDTQNDYVKYGPVAGFIPSDDWFSSTASGTNIIDTSDASYYLSMLSGGANLSFNKRMAVPLYSRVNGKLWVDAAYGRDYFRTGSAADSTCFVGAAKNGDNPSNWQGGTSSIPNKNDIIDALAHMRRDGSTATDSLWLFTGVSTVGTNGSQYFDVELYKQSITYTDGKFISAGTDLGHTQWIFDNDGNIVQTGDMILAVNFSPGSAPVVDVRIWVSRTTFTSIVPHHFDFGNVLDGATTDFGYVSITSKAGATSFGTGTSNYSSNAANDTTYSTPWGTQTASAGWGTQYQSLQLVEIGLNLTRIGVDPALYSALSPCQSMFTNIFFKSRSSNSFTSSMKDFVAPLPFVKSPDMDFSVQSDTLRCNKSSGSISIINKSTIGTYTWTTADGGNITGSTADGSQITLDKPGTYIVSGSPAEGCPSTRTDTVFVPADTFPPVASIYVGIGEKTSTVQFFGGDTTASNYPTPFGGSDGLDWHWTGPGGFVSDLQNPVNDTIWGTYALVVTEKRNGCIDTMSLDVVRGMFTVMPEPNIILTGKYFNKAIALNWHDEGSDYVDYYQIEKSSDGIIFTTTGTVYSTWGINNKFSFTDAQPGYKTNWYRIKAVQKNAKVVYSKTHKIDGADSRFYLSKNPQSKKTLLVCDVQDGYSCNLLICNTLGQVLVNKPVRLQRGLNTIEIPSDAFQKNMVGVIVLLNNNEVLYSEKTFF
jgi:hypothetical protein